MSKQEGMLVLIGVERPTKKHSWARIYLSGSTVQVDLDNITFCPCTSKPRRIEVSVKEEKISENYVRKSITIYATSKEIKSICASLGVGTPEVPVLPEASNDY